MAKQNTIEHRKTYQLADLLDVPLWAALGLMEAFWDWTGRQAQDGDVTRIPLSQIADGVKWRDDPRRLMRLLRRCGIVDEIPGGTLYVHDWHDHAPEFVRLRLQRGGKTFAIGFPPRMPKEGYAAAGYEKPTPLPYLDADVKETPKPPSRHRRDPVSTTAPEKPPAAPPRVATGSSPVRAEARPSPEQPLPAAAERSLGIGGDAHGESAREKFERLGRPGETLADFARRYRAERLAAVGGAGRG